MGRACEIRLGLDFHAKGNERQSGISIGMGHKR